MTRQELEQFNFPEPSPLACQILSRSLFPYAQVLAHGTSEERRKVLIELAERQKVQVVR